MKLFRKLIELRDDNKAALETSRCLARDAEKLAEDATVSLGRAILQYDQAARQADRLSDADHRNHYSESLTHAFRGRTA